MLLSLSRFGSWVPSLGEVRDIWRTLTYSHPTILSWVMFMVIFHSVAFTFEIFDRRRILSKYKIFHGSLTTPSYKKMLPTVLINQVCLLLPLMQLSTQFKVSFVEEREATSTICGQLLSFIACVTIAPFIHEIVFYTAHRYLLHSSWGYMRLNHALHHSSKTHSAISAMFMSPVDFLFEVVMPYLVPLAILTRFRLLTRTHAVCMLPIGTLGGLYEHSGYNFWPMFSFLDTRTHGMHHTFHNCSFADGFGSQNLFDSFFGTACSNYVQGAAMRAAVNAATRLRSKRPKRHNDF